MATSAHDDHAFQQLLNEWAAIDRATGYGCPFSDWVLQWDFVTHYPLDFPELPWLLDICQLLEFDCQALAAQEAALRKKAFRVQVLSDEATGSLVSAFKSLRGPQKPPFLAVTTEVTQPMLQVVPQSFGEWKIAVPSPQLYRPGLPVRAGATDGLVVSTLEDAVIFAAGTEVPPSVGNITQLHHDCTPDELHRGFADFWRPWWQRDSQAEAVTLHKWPAFQRFLQQYPPPWEPLHVDVGNVQHWLDAIKAMRSTSAPGACGFTVPEVKMLPLAAVRHLVLFLPHSLPFGLPTFLLTGRVNVLAKVPDPTGYTDGRPICILPVLYRLWTSVCCKQLLRVWSARMPPGVCGGLPGRSARDITYYLQHIIELSCLSDTPVSGFVLDIVKCFNALPRPPIEALLIHLGCPPHLAQGWIYGLHRMGRASTFAGDVSTLTYSTTGVPEGDGMSVAAAVAVGWLFATVVRDFGLSPQVYIDNWAWSTEQDELHAAGVEQTLQLVKAMRIEVDWRKTFAWSRHRQGRKWWSTHAAALAPPGVTINVLQEAKDLGAAMRYFGTRALGTIKVLRG